MLKNYYMFLFLILCNNNPLFSCQTDTLPNTITSLYREIDGSEIADGSKLGLIVKLLLKNKKNSNYLLCYFRVLLGTSYLLPLFGDEELLDNIDSDKMKQKSIDYELLLYCFYGDYNHASEVIADGANINAKDYTDYTAIFSLEINQKPCSFKEFFIPATQRVNRKLILKNKFFAGEPISKFTPLGYAVKSLAPDIIEKLLENKAFLLERENFQNHVLTALRSDITASKDQIFKAQSTGEIPSFLIERNHETDKSILDNLKTESLCSIYDNTLYIKMFYDKNSVHIQPEKQNNYKENFLDFDSLATVYAHLLIWNKTGTRIANLYHYWQKYEFFKTLVFRYITVELQTNAYAFESDMLPENLLILVKNMLPYIDESSLIEKSLLNFLMRYLFIVASHHTEWKEYYRTLVDLLLQNQEGKLFLQNLSEIDEIFRIPLKREIQMDLLREYLALILSNHGSLLPLEIAKKITAFWTPSEKFIEYVRTRVTNKKIEENQVIAKINDFIACFNKIFLAKQPSERNSDLLLKIKKY